MTAEELTEKVNFNSHTREGVTYPFIYHQMHLRDFNSHTREGVTIIWGEAKRMVNISTHTPVRV